jgi:hypothetical protein
MVDDSIPQERRDFYVYVIFKPDGVPCYVGKGCRGRWKQHVKNSHNKSLRDLFKANPNLEIRKVHKSLTNEEAVAIEMQLIASIGRVEFGGTLVNLTNGGEGTTGWIPTVETRAKIGSLKKGIPLSPEHCRSLGLASKGNPKSLAHRAKISARTTGCLNPMYGKTWNDNQRAKCNRGGMNKGISPSLETRELMRQANTGFRHTAASIEKMRASAPKTTLPLPSLRSLSGYIRRLSNVSLSWCVGPQPTITLMLFAAAA